MEIPPGTPDTCLFSIYQKSNFFPKYTEILEGIDIKINFELENDYSNN